MTEIKNVITEVNEDDILVDITLERAIVCFRATNVVTSVMEGNVFTWIRKGSGQTLEIPFHFKINSDSNKEQWARIMARAFDNKEKKETYPWTLLVNQASAEIEKIIREHKQAFKMDEITEKDFTWVLEPFIQEDQINTFFGMGSSGKTMLSMYFASQLALKTLFIDYENDRGSFKAKLRQLGANQENFIYYESEQIPLFEQVEKIKQSIKEHKIKLVIVDSASLASGDSTSDEKAALKLFAGLKLLRATIVLIAHQRKNEGDKNPIGSIQYENQARNVWNLTSERDSVDDSTLHIACKHTKANNTFLRRNPIGFKIVFGEGIEISREDAIDNFEDKFSVMTRIERLLRQEGGMQANAVSSALNITAGSARKNLTNGKNKGKFINDSNGFWSLNSVVTG